MKYEVIGWVDSEESDYPKHEYITAPVDAVIIKEIRKHGYLFGGDAHEQYCPVLNDGTYVRYSWRGWGRIMALAHGHNGDMDYMMAYMDDMIDPDLRKYPKAGEIDDSRIVLKENLADTFEMHLSDDMFQAIQEGTKTVEVRLFDDKRKRIDIGDYIEFYKNKHRDNCVKMRVIDLKIEHTFKELFERDVDLEKTEMSFSPKQLGFPETSTIHSLVQGMYKYYTKAQEQKYGVIAILLEKPNFKV